MEARQSSSGVQQLIDRLRGEGVQEGERLRDQVLKEAKSKAEQLVEQAMADSKRIRDEAQKEAEKIRTSSEAALHLAVRDASMKLREEITDRLASELRHLVSRQLSDSDFLKESLLEVTRQSTPDKSEGSYRVLLPETVISVEELRQNPEELEDGSLTQFAARLAREVLSKGIELAPGPDNRPGIRIELSGKDVRVDLTDEAVTRLLLKHLMPRFRGLLEGMMA